MRAIFTDDSYSSPRGEPGPTTPLYGHGTRLSRDSCRVTGLRADWSLFEPILTVHDSSMSEVNLEPDQHMYNLPTLEKRSHLPIN